MTRGVKGKQQSAELRCLGLLQGLLGACPSLILTEVHKGWRLWARYQCLINGQRLPLKKVFDFCVSVVKSTSDTEGFCFCMCLFFGLFQVFQEWTSSDFRINQQWDQLPLMPPIPPGYLCTSVVQHIFSCAPTCKWLLQAAKARSHFSAGAPLALSVCFLSPKSLREPPMLPAVKLIPRAVWEISISMEFCQHCH